MKPFTKKDKRTALEKEIDRVTESLEPMAAGTDEYHAVVEDLRDLADIREKTKKTRKGLDPNAIFNGIMTLTGIALILIYENSGNIVRSKALSFVWKGRV